jgi:glycosyltransferase involved in cell wall biosynthesis
MKKILFMAYDLHGGGVEKALVSLLKTIDKSQYTISLLLLENNGIFLSDVDKNIDIRILSLPKFIKYYLFYGRNESIKRLFNDNKHYQLIKFLLLFSYWKYFKKNSVESNLILYCNKIIEPLQEDFDLAIDFQGLGSGLFSTFFIANKVSSNKKMTWIHQDLIELSKIYNIDYDLMQKLYSKFNKINCVSKKTKDIFLKLFPDLTNKTQVIYNVLIEKEIIELSMIEDYNLSTNSIKIVSVGRLTYQKGFDVAISVMKKLSENNFDFKYYIVGDGELYNELSLKIIELNLSDKVFLVGFNKNPYQFMKNCDIYFQPSRFEGFCITLGEAKVFNKPIVTTNFSGASEQILNNHTGIIIDFDEPQMYESLKLLILNENLRDNYKINLKRSFHISETNYNDYFNIDL